MSKLFAFLIAFTGLSLVALDADAKRMGGGRSIGTQRQAVSPQQAPRPPAQQAAPGNPTQQKAAPAAPTPQPSGMSRWLGPLAGLAIGAGLASLFMHNGMGGALAGFLLIAALVIGAVFLVRLLRGSRPAQQPLRYAGATPYGGLEPSLATPPASSIGSTAAPYSVAAATSLPADFNAEEFVRHAKLNFVNLQSAHDRKDLTTIRDFLTPELLKDIEADMRAAGDAPQKTDVVTLEAEVIDVAAENGTYIVSVRFSGLIRENGDTGPQPFSEVWHLEKPVRGSSGWLVSGIQQV
jgi:predicted lipid-binding transport protein (Tim44 family)